MKAYEERSERYRQIVARFEVGFGWASWAFAAIFVLAFVALVVTGAVALLTRVF